MNPQALSILFDSVLACACSALDEMSTCGCPCRKFVAAGPPVWDLEACCPDGQLTVHMDRMYVSGNYPANFQGSIICSAPLAVEFSLTLLRCHPTLSENGDAPPISALDDAANQIHDDLYIMTNAVICCLASTAKRQPFTVLGANILGPQGGCVAAQVRLSAQLSD